MARKGKQGNFHTPKLTSSAGLFEKRGDKWGGSNRPLLSPHNPTEAEREADAIFRKRDSIPVTRITKKQMPSGRWIRRIVSTEETISADTRTTLYAAEIAARLKQANADDPDMDRWTKALQPKVRPEYREKLGKPILPDRQLRATGILQRINARERPRLTKVKAREAKPEPSPVSEDAKIYKLMKEGLSREKARQQVVREREEHHKRMGDYASRKFRQD